MTESKDMVKQLKERYNKCINWIEENIETGSASSHVKGVLDTILEAQVINNILCNDMELQEYAENCHKLTMYRERQENYMYNWLNKNYGDNIPWRAVFNHLLNTSFKERYFDFRVSKSIINMFNLDFVRDSICRNFDAKKVKKLIPNIEIGINNNIVVLQLASDSFSLFGESDEFIKIDIDIK